MSTYHAALCGRCRAPLGPREECTAGHGTRVCEWCGEKFVGSCVYLELWRREKPVDLVLHGPACGKQHLDVGEFRTRVHRKHLCENTPAGLGTGCGHLWVPCEYATRGVLEVIKPEDS